MISRTTSFSVPGDVGRHSRRWQMQPLTTHSEHLIAVINQFYLLTLRVVVNPLTFHVLKAHLHWLLVVRGRDSILYPAPSVLGCMRSEYLWFIALMGNAFSMPWSSVKSVWL